MLVNIDYNGDYDILFIPDGSYDPEELHGQFCKWLYDPNNTHENDGVEADYYMR